MKNLKYLTAIVTVITLSFIGFSSFTSTDKAPAEAGDTYNSIVFVYGVSPGKNGMETVWFPTEDKAIKYAKDVAYSDGTNNSKAGLYTIKRAMVSNLKLNAMRYEGNYIAY